MVAPVSVLIVLSFWKNIEGTADNLMWIGFTTFGTMRVFACYSLTLFIYEISLKIKEVGSILTNKARNLLTVCEFSCLALAIANMEYSNSRYFRYVNILLFFIALSISFSGQSYSNKLFFSEKISTYLGEMSFAVYLVHGPILEVFRVIYPDPAILDTQLMLYLAVVFTSSIVFNFTMKRIIIFTSFLYQKILNQCILA